MVLVLLGHTGRPWAFAGAFGVDVFFVLSGFLITSILLAELMTRGSLSFRRFYSRRALRLYPALVLALMLCFPFRHLMFDEPIRQTAHHYARTAVFSLLYVGNVQEFKDQMGAFAHFWSLAVEEQFYLVWPALLIGLLVVSRRRWGMLTSLVSVLALSLLAWDLWSTAPERGKLMYSYQTLLPTRAWELLLGCLVAVLVGSGAMTHLRRRRWWSLVGTAGLAVIAAAVFHYSAPAVISDDFYRGLMRVGTIAVAAGSMLVILSLAMSERGVLPHVLAARPMVGIGKISYGLYVFHNPIYHLVDAQSRQWTGPGARPLWVDVVRIALTFLVAALSYVLWERPFLRLKSSRRFAARTDRDTTAPDRPGVVAAGSDTATADRVAG